MKRPVLGLCGECGTKKNDTLGKALFRAVKKERKKRGLKPLKAERQSPFLLCFRQG